ncbi:GGDEF domain-containing protein [Temperatibacter marinus]|uniref:diguanylate cyclase n=1 Tax=Temperatibacter marinus TaxID=1456591 RepID=A0AA52EH71_9PROT|nr:GGDEF domain-containing protein [Temperatibacter marinus]WND03093.1 GGDEF domain-containing protein [Temperatibacter marinus]
MKITNSPGMIRSASSRAVKKTGSVKNADSVGRATIPGSTGVNDVVNIDAIPAEEMTPRVQAAFMALMEEVEKLRQELKQTRKKMKELEEVADNDALLPVLNRRAFVRELNRMISFAERYGTPSTLVFFDLNDMKVINDEFGHEAGDRALQHVSQLLLANIRGTDVVARIGGDEFGVLLAQADDVRGAEKAEYLAKAIHETPFEVLEGKGVHLNLAHGHYTFNGDDNPVEALAKADERMYHNKRSMKGEGNVR